MVRASKKVVNGDREAEERPNPETEERRRLKKLAISRNLISQTPSKPISPLSTSKALLKLHGRDIVKKSQRKNKFLFSFPGLLAPITGGKIGELKDLGTKNPILYLDFPQGQVKLFGTILYPKNRYLTLQFGKGRKNVMCEDYFDNMIVFSDAWWIGRKDENPEEVQLEFPKELIEGKHTDYDFKGGAGATCEGKTVANKLGKQNAEPLSPKADPEEVASEDSGYLTGKDLKEPIEVTPVRHSTRTSGKTFNFTEASSGDDSSGSGADISEGKEEKIREKLDDVTSSSAPGKTEDSGMGVRASDNMNVAARTGLSGQNQQSSFSMKSKEFSLSKCSPLVQATISSLFEKVEEKKSTVSVRKSPRTKVSAQKSEHFDSKRKTDQVKTEGPRKKGALIKERKAGMGATTKQKKSQVEDDDIEEFSSESEDIDRSDEDWAA